MALTQLTETLAEFITILVLDFKGDFIDVAQRLGRDLWDHYSTEDGFRLGCGPPEKCIGQVSWISQFTKILAAHCNLKFSEATLASVIRIAFNLLNYPPTGKITWPSLLLIEKLLDVLPVSLIAKKTEYKRTLQQKIEYLRRISGQLFDAEQGFDIYKHLIKPHRCAVVDCTTLSPLGADIVVNLVPHQYSFVTKTLREVSNKTTFALIIDEADPFLSYEACRIYPEGYNCLVEYIKHAREFGGFGGFGVSILGHCSQFAKSNIAYPIIMKPSDPDSETEASRLLLEPDSRHLISSLKCGEFIFKESLGPVPYGMPAKADYVKPSELPRPEKFDKHSYTPARGIDDIPSFRDKLNQFVAKYRASESRQSQSSKSSQKLNKHERAFLDHLSLKEYEPVNIVFSHIGDVSSGAQQQIIRRLKKLEYIKTVRERTGKIYVVFAKLTDAGLGRINKAKQKSSIRGELTHTCICFLKRDLDLEQGAEESICEFQYPNSSGFSDLGSKFNGKWHCTEVVVNCTSNICGHVKSCFIDAAGQVETLTIVTLLKSEHKKILENIMSAPELVFFINRIKFMTLEQIIKELYEK